MKKDLVVFIAHIDDFECACYGYVFKHHKEYDKIKIVTATTWAKKLPVWEENLKLFPKEILDKIEDINLDFPQRQLTTEFDNLKDKFYKIIDFNNRFDILTHDEEDCHSDHTALAKAARGMYKYCNRFVTIYSPSSAHFNPNYFVNLNKTFIDKKISAMECFASQIKEYPQSRSILAIKALSQYRGVTIGVPYAEAFSSERQIDK